MQNEISDALKTKSGQRKALVLIVLAAVIVTAAQCVSIFKQPDSRQLLSLSQLLVDKHQDESIVLVPMHHYSELSEAFPSVAFEVTVPERLIGARYELRAARLVQFDDETALQLYYLDPQKKEISLFVRQFVDELRPLHNRQQLRYDWLVSHWFEGGLFYSLVSPEK